MNICKIGIITGTRPEAIKIAPVYNALKNIPAFRPTIITTGQHQEMLDKALSIFDLAPDFDLKVSSHGQSLNDLTSESISAIQEHLEEEEYDLVLVHGDTISAFTAALAAYHRQIPVGHIEAGLRSYDLNQPYPEEGYRRMIDSIATFHFAPTYRAANNLMNGEISSSITITGNTCIDALLAVMQNGPEVTNECLNAIDFTTKRTILLTTHRRENREFMDQLFQTVITITERYNDVQFIFPMHPNPVIREHVYANLGGNTSVILTEPMDYHEIIYVMQNCWAIMTDSGGIQEEGSLFKKPIVVLREKTERQEIIENGNGVLVGTDREQILSTIDRLYNDKRYYKSFQAKSNPFGDGTASVKIAESIKAFFNIEEEFLDERTEEFAYAAS